MYFIVCAYLVTGYREAMRGEKAGQLVLPEQFWASGSTIQVLAQRDIGQLFRLVQRAIGASQTRLGVAVGLSQAQVSEIMSGGRTVSSVDVLSRIVAGLGIPEPAQSALFLGDVGQGRRPGRADAHSAEDVVTAYAMRGLISRPKWNGTISGTQKCLWLYGMAELGFALDDEVPGLLAEAAARDCDVRVLLLDPAFPGAADIDADEGSPPGTLAARIRSALARYEQMAMACGPNMKIRIYSAQPSVSVVRSDDLMIVTPYLRFFVGSNSPSLELRRASGKMFDRYVKHFQSTWDQAKDWTL
jgi:transcriptional regulator with XRE-family HTH domain